MWKWSSVGCNRPLGPSLFMGHLNLRDKPQELAGRPTPGQPAPPVSRLLSPSFTRRFATPLTYPFLGLIQFCTRIYETKIWINHLGRDEIFACLPKEYLSLISYVKSFAYWPSWYNDLWGMIFPNSKSWRIFIVKMKSEETLIHAQFYQNLSRTIHMHPWYSLIHRAIIYTLRLIKHHCLWNLVMYPDTLVIHEHVHQTKSMNCGSQVALHPLKKEQVTILLV
jgi:hypothetical protein